LAWVIVVVVRNAIAPFFLFIAASSLRNFVVVIPPLRSLSVSAIPFFIRKVDGGPF
jgi:hypothetical protein